MGNYLKVYRRTTDDIQEIPFTSLMHIYLIIHEYREQGIWNNHYEQKALDLQKCIGLMRWKTQRESFRSIKGYCNQVKVTLLMGAFKNPASSLYRAFTKSLLSETRLLILITEF